MDKPDINALAGKMIEAVRGFVQKSESAIGMRLDAIEKQLIETPLGQPGEKGEPGIDGKDGTSGKDGTPGDKGEAGLVGPPGESIKGDTGVPGDAGKDGKDGSQGEKGEPGQSGERGVKGDIGDPGKDAAELDILPSIDESKSYRRGTWASHNGGLIRAARQTDAVKESIIEAGWVVMVEGLSAVVVSQGEKERTLCVASMLTSGTKAVCEFTLPVQINRGVWREAEYERGDVVTWAGSQWHCEVKTIKKPDDGGDWKLIVKRGRDAK